MNEVKWFVKEFPPMFLDYMVPRGWGNGYVALPKDHPWYGLDYNEIPADVHGGLTFGQLASDWSEQFDFDPESWVIGFDTAHFGDNLNVWPKESVVEETLRLFEQVNECYNEN